MGDSLYLSNGQTFVSNTNSGSGFTHYIGEEFGGGIVFHLWKDSNGIEHGLIVSKSETTSVWQTVATLVNADRSWDGVYNTALMINSPVADYVNNFSEGGFTDWYLPSMDEMIKLFSNRFEINQVLFAGGFTVLGSYYNANYFQYWTSNEDQESKELLLIFIMELRVMMIKRLRSSSEQFENFRIRK